MGYTGGSAASDVGWTLDLADGDSLDTMFHVSIRASHTYLRPIPVEPHPNVIFSK